MGFTSYKKTNENTDLETEIRVLETSVTDDMLAGDRVVIKKRIEKLKKALKEELDKTEETVAGDIAVATPNLMTDCTGEAGCECQKCKLLKRDKGAMAVQESMNFGSFFSK